MKFLSSLDQKDRRMLLLVLGLIVVLFIALAAFTPQEDPNNSRVPDSYLSGQHGAKAAFTLLQQSGYTVERWEQPLSLLADRASPATVLILAEPFPLEKVDREAIRSILTKGGRVLATGFFGGTLLPNTAITESKSVSFAPCEAQPEGLQPLAAAGSIWIVPRATWSLRNPEVRVAYACGNEPVVVEYAVGKGTAVWWAASTPLENASIARSQNLDLLLNSIGPSSGHQVFWDESLHGRQQSQWDFVTGPVWPLLWAGAVGLAFVALLSFSRRSGPIRALPVIARTTPIEFLDALGGLYRSTGANATAAAIAWDRFRTVVVRLTGLSGKALSNSPGKTTAELDARQITAAIERRFGTVARAMEPDLIRAEEACWNDRLKPRHALAIVQSLRRHEETLRTASSQAAMPSTVTKSKVASPVTLGS